jgi:NDP-sugar pyrophosphorylase family protein
MNPIIKKPLSEIGYKFIPEQYIPAGEDEYYLRRKQNRSGIQYRKLTHREIDALIRNNNTSDNWEMIEVTDVFSTDLIQNCKFYGWVRIGNLEPCFLEFHAVKLRVGFYNSTIISCDFGDNVSIDNVHYLSHYIIGNECIITNVHEMGTTNYAKFGNGVIKQGEEEKIRIWLEVCNENAGRKIVPFNGMLPGDAWMWSRNRDNKVLQQKFLDFTEQKFDKLRGYYGKVGDRTVIKSVRIIKDVWIGSHAYIKGANKIKNVTINSTERSSSQVGEGCELVNGIIGEGCRVFYGVKAVRFYLASHSQLKYGARLINSYLGNNATISCCEVLNSLIFPAHEQHHNNSFLCAATVMGQSNIAAGATLGSNHNSRSADGELIAGRGFWPALCVSIKHNSKFASYTLLAKGDYPAELNIPIPFALVGNDESSNQLQVMPAYWFLYNMYALDRNAWKYVDRDKRNDKTQFLEYGYLAPDTVNEVFEALRLLELFTGKAALKKENASKKYNDATCIKKGKALLAANDKTIDALEILADGFENTKRKTVILKARQSYQIFKELIGFYAADELLNCIKTNSISSFHTLNKQIGSISKRKSWVNAGGQLMEASALSSLQQKIVSGKIKGWDAVHEFYRQQSASYPSQKLQHAIASYCELKGIKQLSKTNITELLAQFIKTREWMVKGIYDSRAKDYSNPFRNMVYENMKEQEEVTGSLSGNSFILQQQQELKEQKKFVTKILKSF